MSCICVTKKKKKKVTLYQFQPIYSEWEQSDNWSTCSSASFEVLPIDLIPLFGKENSVQINYKKWEVVCCSDSSFHL